MSTTLEPTLGTSSVTTDRADTRTVADRIRHNFAACRIKFKWLRTTKSPSAEQKSHAAESFWAEGDSITAGKKPIDTKYDSYKALTSIKSQINSLWKSNSLPYPEAGIRLSKQDRIDEFNVTLEDGREQLEAGVR